MIGLIGKKIGMTQVFDEAGNLTPVTVIQVSPNTVLSIKNKEKDGYDAVVLGAEDLKKSRITKPVSGQYPEDVNPKKFVKEFRGFTNEVAVGNQLGVELFESTRFVDVVATSKGKGTQGVMKRWGFGGGRKSHGSKFHREAGGTGQCTYPGKTFKNVKMAGRMGRERVTVQNLKIVKVDPEMKVMMVRGSVPGNKDCTLIIKSAVKKER